MRITLYVKPNSFETKIISFDEKQRTMHVSVAEPPDKDKANIAVLKLLRRHFKKQVKLVRGRTSREKVVEVADCL